MQSRVESSAGAVTMRSLQALTNMVADVALQQASFLERATDEEDLELRRQELEFRKEVERKRAEESSKR